MASYGRIVKTGTLWGFFARGMNEAVAIPTAMILARLLTPHDFGVAAAAAFFVQLAHRMTNFGFNTALVQIRDLDKRHTSTVFIVYMVMGIGVWLGLTLGADWLGSVFRSRDASLILPVVALTFLIGPITSVPTSLMVRDLRFRETSMLDALATWVTAVSGVALAFLGYGYWSLVYSQVIGAAVPAAARLWISGWWPSFAFSPAALRELLAFGIGLHAKRLLDSTAQNLDTLVVGRMLGISALGFYDKAFTMMNRAVTLLSSAGPAVSFRILAIISDDDERFRAAYRKLLLTSTFIAYPVLAAFVAVAPELFLFMFGPQWGAAILPFRILCVAGVLKFVNAYASTATQSKGRVWGEVWRQSAYIVLIVVAAGIGSRYGLVGVAVGVLSATVVMTIMMHDFLRRTTSVSWGDMFAAQTPALACALGLWVFLAVLRTVLAVTVSSGLSAFFFLILSVGVSALYCLAFIRLTRFKELEAVLQQTIAEFAPSLAWLLAKRSSDDPLTIRG